MASQRNSVRPRTFFLNEKHELTPEDKSGGGHSPQFVDVPWARKAERISSSISKVVEAVSSSHDPLRDERYFVVAKPESEVKKRSKDLKKAPEGTYSEQTQFGDIHGRIFDRLGLDLLQVTDDGDAVVHGNRERIEQLLDRASLLESLGAREQARWVTIDQFETVPMRLRVDGEWLNSLKTDQASDVVFELQPVLSRVDADRVVRAIADILAKAGQRLTGSGSDFSGRFWFRGKANRISVRTIAKDFFSVQAIHTPLYSVAAAGKRSVKVQRAVKKSPVVVAPPDAASLPCVAIVDLGIPAHHIQLGPYRRGQFVPQYASAHSVSDHASFVASRVVFGEHSTAQQLGNAVGRCSIYDAVVGDGSIDRVNDKIVMEALRGVRGAAPDVRVFNLSFGDSRPLVDFSDVEQREKRLMLQDLDNFAFANDVVVVVAAGNSKMGVPPDPEYPNHFDDHRWALGPWACGFNTLVCGAFVGRVSANGLVQTVGWPSPFSRIGPGLCDAPIPSFCAEGGNSDNSYNAALGSGVWGFAGTGMPEDRIGTSYSAPLLAREVAIALGTLQEQYCPPGTQPFSVTVRAFLALTAQRTTDDQPVGPLAARTLGYGKASSARLHAPVDGSAVILWQGVVENVGDVLRVQLPIPADWLAEAAEPILRIFVCYDPPVNEAAKAIWACRRLKAVLHPGVEARALRGASVHGSYPLFGREYRLENFAPGRAKRAEGDMWLLELSYDDIFDYPPGMDFDSRQRVAFAAELIDRGATAIDPQPALQALPAAASMTRLSIQPAPIRTPLVIRARNI